MILNILLVIVGFVLLIKGADFFVDGSSSLASKLGIPSLIIGLTIVAMGTSAPEAAVSISAAFKGSTGIAIGNIYGSNILNILVILGVTACISQLKVGKTTIKYELPFMIFITVVLAVIGGITGNINKMIGVVLWILFIVYLAYLFYQSKHMETEEDGEIKDLSAIKIIVYIIGGMAAIIAGSNITVDGATAIAEALGVSDRVIGLTIVALGTSLPELITSVTAARKNQADIAIGNIVGSNIFNILFVLGTASLIHDITYSAAFIFDSVITVAASVLLFLCVFKKEKLTRGSGILMLGCYAVYLVYMLVG
ncbi:MAG: calcium/sodium antiporter [Lachnospiraceae bacterium]|nr:calcium/sodium antiporter [Lachnospiraceae bacterium]